MAAKTTKAKTGTKATPPTHNPPGFAALVLQNLRIKPTASKVAFFNLWFANEGNNSGGANGVNNPLNVKGSNPVPYNYSTPQEGAIATANAIRYNSGILKVLQNPRATVSQLASAVENSRWDGAHYGATLTSAGTYVGGLLSREAGKVSTKGISLAPPAVTAGGTQQAPTNVGASTNPNPPGTIVGAVIGGIGAPFVGAGSTTASGVKAVTGLPKTVENTAVTIGHYAFYAVVIIGGILLLIAGFLLIAADIGLGGILVHNNPAVKAYDKVSPKKRQERADESAAQKRTVTVRRETGEARLYRAQSNAESARHRARSAKAKADRDEARNAPIDGDFPEGF